MLSWVEHEKYLITSGPDLTQTVLFSHRRWLEAWYFGLRKGLYHLCSKNQKPWSAAQYLGSTFAVTEQLIYAFVFAYARIRFPHEETQMKWFNGQYSQTCLKRLLKNRQNGGLKGRWYLNAGLKYCRMLPRSILQYFWPALSDYQSWKSFLLPTFEWPFKTGLTVTPVMHQ